MDIRELDALLSEIESSPRPVVTRLDRLICEVKQTRYAINAIGILMFLGFIALIALAVS